MINDYDPGLLKFYYLDFEDYTVTVSMPKHFFPEALPMECNMNTHSGFELHFPVSGKMEVFAGEEELVADKWTYVLIPPGVPHGVMSPPGIPSTRYRFQIKFEKKAEGGKREIKAEKNSIISDFVNAMHGNYIKGYSENVFQCLKKIELETKVERMFSDQTVELYLKIIIIDILRNIYRNESVKSSKVTTLDERRAYIIDKFFNYNYFKSYVDKSDLADHLYLSKRQLERLLMKLYGQSFTEKLAASRIEQAKFLLTSTGCSLSEVASMSGFASVKYFNHVFKEKTGNTPFKYRKENLQKTGWRSSHAV